MKLSSKKPQQNRMTPQELRQWLDDQDAMDKASLDLINVLFETWLLNIQFDFHHEKRSCEELIEIKIKEYWGQDAKAIFFENEKKLQLCGSQDRIIWFGK